MNYYRIILYIIKCFNLPNEDWFSDKRLNPPQYKKPWFLFRRVAHI